MVVLGLIAVLAAVVAAAVVFLRTLRTELVALRDASGSQLAERNAEVDRRLQALGETIDRRLGSLDDRVDRRLVSATWSTTAIHERLGKVDEATSQMLERAKELGRLEQALRPPKARGGFGELLLENLLRDRLPPSAFHMQHTFASGERVDAIVRVDRLIPVDSKFPLDN